MTRLPQGRPLYKLFWLLYIVLGLISIAVGATLTLAPTLFFPAHTSEHDLAQKIGVVFLLFGIVRIVTAMFRLRGLARRQQQ